MQKNQLYTDASKKYLGKAEWIFYVMSLFFYSNMTGMMGSYRNAYLVNVLHLPENMHSLFNTLSSIIPFVLNFFIAMYIDGRKPKKSGKFRPLALLAAIPIGLTLVLSFWTPSSLEGSLLMLYLVTVSVSWSVATIFGNSVNMVAVVMTPNMKERDSLISFRSISSAVGNSAPLVIVLVLGLIPIFKGNEQLQYFTSACLCAAVGVITMLLGMRFAKERVTYNTEKKNPLVGIGDVLKNKWAWVIIFSETLKNFRAIATSVGVFLAAALLGSTDKFLLFGLPTGIGTAVGMLVVNFLLKKFNSKILYIASGIYSLIINTFAFFVGYIYFKTPNPILLVLFIFALFLIGLQFGASNLLPTMFQADVLEDIEYNTGKRLDATLPFIIGVGTTISGTVANALFPVILRGENSIIGYIAPTDLVPEPVQSFKTKVMMLFFYTIFHGIMMFLAGVPFFAYKLTGERKEKIHEAVLLRRAELNDMD